MPMHVSTVAMLTQRNSDDIPPPYTPGRAPPSYPNPDDAAQESLNATHAAQALAISAPTALDTTTRVSYNAPPVLSSNTTYDDSRLPFKFTTRPSPAYILSATSHTYVAIPEPDLTTSSPGVATTPSRTLARRRRPTGWCGCICTFVLIVLLITGVALLDKRARDSAAKHPKKHADAPKVNHAEPSCSFLIFC